jgi:hypothetical protein
MLISRSSFVLSDDFRACCYRLAESSLSSDAESPLSISSSRIHCCCGSNCLHATQQMGGPRCNWFSDALLHMKTVVDLQGDVEDADLPAGTGKMSTPDVSSLDCSISGDVPAGKV